MIRPEWDREFERRFNALRAKGYDLERARAMALAICLARFGSRPATAPLWLRFALKLAGRKLAGLAPAEEKTMGQKLLYAALYGVSAALGALQVAGLPKDEQGWLALGVVFFVAFWGKLTHTDNVIDPRKAIWTDEQRAAAQAANGK